MENKFAHFINTGLQAGEKCGMTTNRFNGLPCTKAVETALVSLLAPTAGLKPGVNERKKFPA